MREQGKVDLANDNIDVGEFTPRGKYRLYDKTCAELLNKLASKHFADTSPELRAALLRFYAEPAGPDDSKLNKKDREKLQTNLEQLKATSPNLNATEKPQNSLN